MLTRAFILEGDTTTANGLVQVQPGIITVGEPPKYICFEGDPVYCPSCQSIGVTKCIPPFRPWTSPDGRQVNLEGDLCICKCPRTPKLVARGDEMKMYFESHEAAQMGDASSGLAETEPTRATARFDQFVVHDKTTGQPVSGFSYGLETSAGQHHDALHEDGATAKVHAPGSEELTLSYLVQTEIGVRR